MLGRPAGAKGRTDKRTHTRTENATNHGEQKAVRRDVVGRAGLPCGGVEEMDGKMRAHAARCAGGGGSGDDSNGIRCGAGRSWYRKPSAELTAESDKDNRTGSGAAPGVVAQA